MTASDFLNELRARGALRIRRVTFRNNRNTVWSLTQGGTVLNVHAAYRTSPPALLDAFATVAIEGGIGSKGSRKAARTISSWPDLTRAMKDARSEHQRRRSSHADGTGTHCAATPAQRRYLRSLYAYFNKTRFSGALPPDIPVRLSSRMQSALGHMLPGERSDGSRFVVEVALNVDLMLPGNGAERADTLLHEMAHIADYLESGSRGHGASWKEWARSVGCRPTTLYDRPVQYRARRRSRVERVPPLPDALWESTSVKPAPPHQPSRGAPLEPVANLSGAPRVGK